MAADSPPSIEGIALPSTDAQSPRRRRGLKWLLFAAVALIAVYIGGWFYLSAQVQSEFDRALANLNRDGVIAQCANRKIGGFPFSLGLDCESLTYEDDGKATYASTGAMRSHAHIADPMLAEIELDGPLRMQAPSLIPIWMDWERLSGDVRFGFPMPKRVFLEGEDLAAQSDPEDESNPEQLFNLASLNAWLAPSGSNIECAGEFKGLELAPAATGGRTIPVLEGKGAATIVNGLTTIAARSNSFRGQAVEIKNLSLSSGEASVALSGPASVDGDGLLDAQLKVMVTNPQALSEALQQAVPEHADEIRSGLGGLAVMGKEVSLPLNIAKGRAWLGPIPLGNLPPLD